MIGLAVAVAALPPLILAEAFSVWIYRGLIVLIIACPSALVISTPVTVLLGLTRAMWNGILVKGGMYLEEISRVRVVAFDKTGTLTLGKLQVSKVWGMNGHEENEVLRLAAIAESRTAHPIGAAIVEEAKRRGIETVAEVEIIDHAGQGINAVLTRSSSVLVGKPSFLAENGIAVSGSLPELSEEGTFVAVASNGRQIGIIVVVDQLRAEAKAAVAELRKIGVEKVTMLTGDTESVAKKIAAEAGVTDYYAQLLPQDKVKIAGKLRQDYGAIAMVGDGINDAPVLAASSVGIALGTAGNDIAIEAADVALMGSDLGAVPYLIRLGRKVVWKLKTNIAIALTLKFLMIGLGSLGLVPLWFAVIGDDGVTLLVIANALPLLRFRQS
jgi:Cd2+/Zn2+-exporting ATPase